MAVLRLILLAAVLLWSSCERAGSRLCEVNCRESPCPTGWHCTGKNQCTKDSATAIRRA